MVFRYYSGIVDTSETEVNNSSWKFHLHKYRLIVLETENVTLTLTDLYNRSFCSCIVDDGKTITQQKIRGTRTQTKAKEEV